MINDIRTVTVEPKTQTKAYTRKLQWLREDLRQVYFFGIIVYHIFVFKLFKFSPEQIHGNFCFWKVPIMLLKKTHYICECPCYTSHCTSLIALQNNSSIK